METATCRSIRSLSNQGIAGRRRADHGLQRGGRRTARDGHSALSGPLAAWNYYQSVDTPQNKKCVANFKAYCKRNNLPDGEKRVTDDPIEAAYFGVYMWKQAVEKAGEVT